MEKPTREGDSPVLEMLMSSRELPSKAGHVESRLNPPGPSGKTKHYSVTDSEPVP